MADTVESLGVDTSPVSLLYPASGIIVAESVEALQAVVQ